uniref:Uncharacterized protein n=1 Tax=Panagrolaimus superbus TaxID=310955 RepID=A0A914Z3G4_9BILA
MQLSASTVMCSTSNLPCTWTPSSIGGPSDFQSFPSPQFNRPQPPQPLYPPPNIGGSYIGPAGGNVGQYVQQILPSLRLPQGAPPAPAAPPGYQPQTTYNQAPPPPPPVVTKFA